MALALVLVGVVEELLIGVHVPVVVLAVVARRPQVPAGEHTRGGVDVRLGVVADADREELHDLAAEVLLRLRFGVALAIEPDHHRGILRHLHQEIAEVAERVLAEELDLSLRPAQHAGLVREHLGPQDGPESMASLL